MINYTSLFSLTTVMINFIFQEIINIILCIINNYSGLGQYQKLWIFTFHPRIQTGTQDTSLNLGYKLEPRTQA